jgi:hypothetical protein
LDTGHSALVALWLGPSVVLALRWGWLPSDDTHAVRWDREGCAALALTM